MSSNPSGPEAPRPSPTISAESAGAAQARVTGDELTRALALIEARKDAEAYRSANTIPLGQAVEELGLEITPEELLAEVQALRQASISPVVELPTGLLPQETPAATTLVAPPTDAQASPLTQCPACSRRLLTQASALCNWCGAKIDDSKYQEQAARSRQQLDQSELNQLETMVQEETRYGIFGRLKRRAKSLGAKDPLG